MTVTPETLVSSSRHARPPSGSRRCHRLRKGEENRPVPRKAGAQGHIEEAALAVVDNRRHAGERRRSLSGSGDAAQAARSLGDQHRSVRQERQRPGAAQTRRNQFRLEGRRHRRRRGDRRCWSRRGPAGRRGCRRGGGRAKSAKRSSAASSRKSSRRPPPPRRSNELRRRAAAGTRRSARRPPAARVREAPFSDGETDICRTAPERLSDPRDSRENPAGPEQSAVRPARPAAPWPPKAPRRNRDPCPSLHFTFNVISSRTCRREKWIRTGVLIISKPMGPQVRRW